ncbi:hypothetical protein BHE74_00033257 [Ensete ventricosum]|nr:hypothetical protein BHE74_00033257 [Ensete ventricosum]
MRRFVHVTLKLVDSDVVSSMPREPHHGSMALISCLLGSAKIDLQKGHVEIGVLDVTPPKLKSVSRDLKCSIARKGSPQPP